MSAVALAKAEAYSAVASQQWWLTPFPPSRMLRRTSQANPPHPSRIRITRRLRRPALIVRRRSRVHVIDAARCIDQIALRRERIEQRLVHPLAREIIDLAVL